MFWVLREERAQWFFFCLDLGGWVGFGLISGDLFVWEFFRYFWLVVFFVLVCFVLFNDKKCKYNLPSVSFQMTPTWEHMLIF